MVDDHASHIPLWSVGAEKVVYDSPWVQVLKVEVVPPGGGAFSHHVIRLQRIVVVAVVDPEQRVLMLRRHRFVTNQVGWELPQGIVEADEKPELAASREVLEETGWKIGALRKVLEYQPMIGMVDTPHEIFVAQGAKYVALPSDPDESGAVEWIELKDALGMIERGEVLGSGSITGLLLLLARNGHRHVSDGVCTA